MYRKGRLDIKIADFGLSVQVKEGQEMKTLVGTAEYVCKLLSTKLSFLSPFPLLLVVVVK